MDRRRFFKLSLFSSVALSYKAVDFDDKIKPSLGNIQELISQTDMDIIDKDPTYISSWSDNNLVWNSRVIKLFKSIKRFKPTVSNSIVEFGSFRGKSLLRFAEMYPGAKIKGYESYEQEPHDGVRSNKLISLDFMDVRNIDLKSVGKIEIAWSNVSYWYKSPRSKLFVKKLIEQNLVSGGLIIDDTSANLPNDLVYEGCEKIYDDSEFTIYRKV